MPDGNNTGRDLATLPLAEAIEAYTPQFADALPDNIPLQRFKRTVQIGRAHV